MILPDDREQLGRVRERFTRTAGVFSDFALTNRAGEAERLADLAAPQGTERALDLACGPGTFAWAFAPRVRWLCGLDLTPAMLARARRAAAEAGLTNITLACGDARALPFPDDAFDLASCAYSLHHMSEPAEALEELGRAVRPGGRLALLDMIVPEDPARAEANNRIERARDVSHTRTLSAAEMERILAAAGFRLRRSESQQLPRSFDLWMSVAGWKRGDRQYEETRRLMEASIAGDAAGFHPRLADAGARGDSAIEFVQTSAFFVAERD